MPKFNLSHLYKALIEFGPILVFIVLFEARDFYTATYGMIMVTILFLLVSFLKDRHIPVFPILVSLFTLFFGFLTIFFKNPKILILRDTLYDLFFAVSIFGGLFFNKLILKSLFDYVYQLPDDKWKTLSYIWGIYFLMGGMFNEFIRNFGNEKMWITFKVTYIFITIAVAFISLKAISYKNKQIK